MEANGAGVSWLNKNSERHNIIIYNMVKSINMEINCAVQHRNQQNSVNANSTVN